MPFGDTTAARRIWPLVGWTAIAPMWAPQWDCRRIHRYESRSSQRPWTSGSQHHSSCPLQSSLHRFPRRRCPGLMDQVRWIRWPEKPVYPSRVSKYYLRQSFSKHPPLLCSPQVYRVGIARIYGKCGNPSRYVQQIVEIERLRTN